MDKNIIPKGAYTDSKFVKDVIPEGEFRNCY
jgi:hypothetical protein